MLKYEKRIADYLKLAFSMTKKIDILDSYEKGKSIGGTKIVIKSLFIKDKFLNIVPILGSSTTIYWKPFQQNISKDVLSYIEYGKNNQDSVNIWIELKNDFTLNVELFPTIIRIKRYVKMSSDEHKLIDNLIKSHLTN